MEETMWSLSFNLPSRSSIPEGSREVLLWVVDVWTGLREIWDRDAIVDGFMDTRPLVFLLFSRLPPPPVEVAIEFEVAVVAIVLDLISRC
jgi:hypothetical protein